MVERILRILSLPKTAVIGKISLVFNDYTLFVPYKKGLDFTYLLVTELTPYQRRRIELGIPQDNAEMAVYERLCSKKQVFALDSLHLTGAIAVPDCSTRLICAKRAKAFPFGKMIVPMGCIITDLAKEQGMEFEVADLCKSEKYAAVFGQPKNQSR